MRSLQRLSQRYESAHQHVLETYGGRGIFAALSWDRHTEFDTSTPPAEQFDTFRRAVSITEWCDSNGVMPRLLTYGFPVTIYLLGYVLSRLTDTAPRFLHDPVPLVFAGVSFVFIHTIFRFDRQLFDVIESIEPAFEMDEAAYYSFFGELVERVYEPWRRSYRSGSGRIHAPTAGGFLLGMGYVIGLAVTNVGNAPSGQPLAMRAYFWLTTLIGVFGLVVIGWTVFVIFVFMAIAAKQLPIRLVLTRNHNNLGLQPYGRFVVSITIRIFVALAIGGIATVTRPSPFIYSIFVFVSVVILSWFVGTQYGLHRSIVEAKERSLRKIEEEYPVQFPSEIVASTATDVGDGASIEHARTGIVLKRQIDSLPDWPVNLGNVLKLAGSVAGSTLSVFGSLVYEALAAVL
jgi:hypothetical protein